MSLALFEPYVDGYIDPIGKETTIVPRVRFPFKPFDTYSRMYERDYDSFPGSPPRIDVRTAWTNLLTYSETFDNAAWTKTNLSVTADSVTAPDGRVTMDKLLETTTNAEHSVAQAATVSAAPHEVSFFIKGGLTRSWVRGAFTDSAATVFSAFFSSSGYAISASAGVTAGIAALGNGHFYCWLRFTPASGAGTFKVNLSTDGSTISYAGSTSSGIYLWGAQVALGSVAPYISTLGAARSILAPDRDPRDPMAYLLMETDPEPINSARERVTRTFGRIPRTQTVIGSRSIPKPKISGTFPRVINGVLVDQPDLNVDEYTFFSQVAVTNDTGAPTFGITGGTFDLTFGAATASLIDYDATAIEIQNEINALGPIDDRNGVTVTGGPTQFLVQFTPWPTATADASGLTVSVGTPTFAVTYENVIGAASPFRQHVRFRMGNNGFITAGAYTITLLGEETAPISFDATKQDVEDAINALTVIGSGAGISIPNSNNYSGNPLSANGNYIDFVVTLPMPTTSTADTFTPSGTATLTVANGTINGVQQFGWYLTLTGGAATTRTVTAAGHGITAADDIVVTSAGTVIPLTAGTFSVPNANTIQFTSASGVVFYGGTITAVGKDNGNRYAADSPQIATNFVTSYYLPGVSPGIDEVDDIVIPARGTPSQLLGAIFSGATLFNYDVGEFLQWLETPITSITLTTINPQLLVSPDA